MCLQNNHCVLNAVDNILLSCDVHRKKNKYIFIKSLRAESYSLSMPSTWVVSCLRVCITLFSFNNSINILKENKKISFLFVFHFLFLYVVVNGFSFNFLFCFLHFKQQYLFFSMLKNICNNFHFFGV
jgi:hypothetical protein